ncbi:hypothetical protein LCGC14_1425800 [marine sediment metagenome]|uniref:YqaJ viral recombinase domain-containing protein n=1 Tax=marine sediment metagenome TaxID=412755 RepID=A0A0F9JQH3_9ZZZZ
MTTAIAMPPVELLGQAEWEELHYDREHISASRIGGALGYSKFEGNSPLSHYSELRREIPRPDLTLQMMLGHMLEPPVTELYEMFTGRPTEDPGEYAIVRHPDLPALFCTLDRVTQNKVEEPGPLELKTTGSYNKSEWEKGEGPVEYQIQNLVQMMCCGFGWGSLAVLVGNQDFFSYDFLRDDDLAEVLLTSIDAFMDRVKKGDAPDPTWQDGEVMKKLHPLDNGKTVAVETDYVYDLITRWEADKELLKVTQKTADERKFKLAAVIGDNTFLECRDKRYSYKHQTRTTKATVAPEKEHMLEECKIDYKPSKTSDFRVMRKAK